MWKYVSSFPMTEPVLEVPSGPQTWDLPCPAQKMEPIKYLNNLTSSHGYLDIVNYLHLKLASKL